MKAFDLLPLALCLFACSPETPESSGNMVIKTFTAYPEALTRTSLDSSYGIRWSTSDAITVFSGTGSAGTTFNVASTSSDGSVATFSGLTSQSSADFSYAVYPASSCARLVSTEGIISSTLPTVQTGEENSFAPLAGLSVAKVEAGAQDSDILHFKNVGALLSFTVPGNYICRVRIESRNENVAMTGPASIDYNGGEPTVVPGSSAKNYVDVLVPEQTLGKRYYAVVYPGNYDSGFKVSFYTSVNYYNRYTSTAPLNLPRNGNVRLIEKNWVLNNDRDKSETGYEDITGGPLTVSIGNTAANYYNFVVNYTLDGVTATGAEHGLVFSYTNTMPTCGAVGAEGKLPGPVLTATGTVSLRQCVPNSVLRPLEPCYIRAYCYDQSAGNYVYSDVTTLTLAAQPQALGIALTAMDSPSSAISLYSLKADGSYDGYVAKADCSSSSPIRLGVWNAPMGSCSALSMSSQSASSGALVLINGQIFGDQGNIGLAYTRGELRYNNSSAGISNCRGYSNTYTTTWQPVTRAILGVDASGTPGAYWCSLIDGRPYFFDRPIPAGTAGNAVYPQVTASSGPGPARAWSPSESLSTGPMLLYNGNVCVSEDKISTGVYYTNYELWETTSGNIYGSSRPRTAIGYVSDTGMIFLVTVTSNVTLTRMALIMKGLGCDYAMNLDGGGSTQMYVSGKGELTNNNRNVKSTIGFFAK